MFYKTFISCFCMLSLYGSEESVTNSHLSFIYKEKLKENKVSESEWSIFSGALGEPKMSINVSLQNASEVITFLTSHQNILSVLSHQKLDQSWQKDPKIASETDMLDENKYIAQASINEANQGADFFKSSVQGPSPYGTIRIPGYGQERNDVWIGFFGDKTKFRSAQGLSDSYNTSLGFLINYDRFMQSGMITTAIGYNYSKTMLAGNSGEGRQNQLFGIFRGTAYLPLNTYLGYSLYGAVNSGDFERYVNMGVITKTAKSHFTSGTLAPHIDFGYDWRVNDWFIVQPFISNDFYFHFQPSYAESGVPVFNEYQESLKCGLYAVKPGLNFYQYFNKKSSLLLFRQAAAYERAKPIFGTKNKVTVIDVQNDIPTPTGLRDFNLLIFEFQVFARTAGGFYGDALYQGGWGADLASSTLHLKLGHFF